MSNKLVSVLGASVSGTLVLGLFAFASTTAGCGSSGGGVSSGSGGGAGNQPSAADIAAACTSVCNKEATCNPTEATIIMAVCMSTCTAAEDAGTSGSGMIRTSCPTLSANQALAMVNACASGTCAALTSCLDAICPSSDE
jgi:hypothetical protein